MSLAERFWCKVARGGPDECWPWQAGKNAGGYGRITVHDGRAQPIQYAHRVAWELTRGSLGGLFVLHRCDNPACCNPAHLFLGTQTDNMRDRDAKGRLNPPRGSKSGRAKLTEAAVEEIRALALVARQRDIAALYGVHRSTVTNILSGKTWSRANAA
jgi:hypothetical protein